MARFLHLPSPDEQMRRGSARRHRQPLRRLGRVHRRADDHAVLRLPHGRPRRSRRAKSRWSRPTPRGSRRSSSRRGTKITALQGERQDRGRRRRAAGHRVSPGQRPGHLRARRATVKRRLALRSSRSRWLLTARAWSGLRRTPPPAQRSPSCTPMATSARHAQGLQVAPAGTARPQGQGGARRFLTESVVRRHQADAAHRRRTCWCWTR